MGSSIWPSAFDLSCLETLVNTSPVINSFTVTVIDLEEFTIKVTIQDSSTFMSLHSINSY